jgi:hypothetical protein
VHLQVKLLYQACVSPDSNLADAKKWLETLFDLKSIEGVMDFAAKLGLFVFYEVNIDARPLSMVSTVHYCMAVWIFRIFTVILPII